ncbi:MAG: adenosylcobalamin-dependent ribonucleoside-diphosphate reductase [Nitrospiraceae bacterium]|nr:MAG: adenosylcobalamin-dependent ribonucleoside-diphosphate reductase [Nitrospiraceae bacterium]
MKLTRNALTALKARYLLKDKHGRVTETPEEMFHRVARAIASAEKIYGERSADWEKRYYDVMSSLLFLPNTPTLINAGKELGQLAACFVLPVEDSMTSIFETLKNAALILQSGGGTGFSFSHLRPRSDIVKSTGGIASGPVSFMRIYNTATEVIKQGGARRGANMGILRVDHPDVLEFIRIKRRAEELSNFNISMAVTDDFMRALRKNSSYRLRNPRSGEVTGHVKAQAVFDEIVESAWETGDPGLVFIDRINRDNPTPHMGAIESTNPCGEQPLLPFEACILGSINLSRFVRTEGASALPRFRTSERIDWDRLDSTVRLAVRFLDDAIDANIYPIPQVEAMHRGNRKIGLGVMGWADLLIMLGMRYNSPDAFHMARTVMRFIRDCAREASSGLAKDRGVFPNYSGSVYDTPAYRIKGGMRNATTTTIAPTGSLSLIAGCSSGIEPLFAVAYRRRVLEQELFEIHPLFLDIAKKRGFYTTALMDRIAGKGSLRGIREVPRDVKRLFITAHDISPEDHIAMQAAFQEFTDNAVSKTVNLKHRASRDDVAKAFLLAYEQRCKGVTVFRYGSKPGTLLKLDEVD